VEREHYAPNDKGHLSLAMPDPTAGKRTQGFSLIELVFVAAVILLVAAIAVPRLMNSVNDIALRYTASDISSLLQSARIQAVKKNTFYSVVQGGLPSGQTGIFVDLSAGRTGTFANGDPFLPLKSGITTHLGTGSGAPNEAAFIAGLGFAINAAGNSPTFNARGLPCVVAGAACPQAAGQGFVVFLSKIAVTGNIPWASVVITPSGHVQLWTCDNLGTWVQRD
jgi:prepilin-type N-terminal cleavage/methylation domain-containing protein